MARVHPGSETNRAIRLEETQWRVVESQEEIRVK